MGIQSNELVGNIPSVHIQLCPMLLSSFLLTKILQATKALYINSYNII